MSFFSAIGGFFTSIRNWFADPATTQAVKNAEVMVEEVAEALICDISAGAQLAAAVMAEVGTGASTQGTTSKIYVASGTVCSALRGTLVAGQAAQNVPAVTAVTSA